MRARLSNGYSFAVEFSAGNQAEFRTRIRRAALEYFAHEGRGRHAELQVASDTGVFLSANYPKSNAPYPVRFGQFDAAAWRATARSNKGSTWFEIELKNLTRFVQCRE